MASSSVSGVTTAGLALGAGFFFWKRATVLNVTGLEAEGAVLEEKLSGFPRISDTPREAAAVDAANEAILSGDGCRPKTFELVGLNMFVCLMRIEKGEGLAKWKFWWIWNCHVGYL